MIIIIIIIIALLFVAHHLFFLYPFSHSPCEESALALICPYLFCVWVLLFEII